MGHLGASEALEVVMDFCMVHGVEEPSLPGDYTGCGECNHVWRTQKSFWDDCIALCRDLEWPIDLDLPFCPLCSHDW